MRRIYAGGIVATMQDVQTTRNIASIEQPSGAMRADLRTVDTDNPILLVPSIISRWTGPEPATRHWLRRNASFEASEQRRIAAYCECAHLLPRADATRAVCCSMLALWNAASARICALCNGFDFEQESASR